MIRIKVDVTERQTNALAREKVDLALKALDEDGVVVLENAIALENIERLGQKMLADLDQFANSADIDNNYQGIRPPPFHPYLFADIIFNEPMIAIGRRLLGEDLTLCSYGANTAFVGSTPQRVHADAVPTQPGPYGPCELMVVNVPLIDMTLENGATIFWPGTHKDTRLHSGNRHPTEAMITEQETKRASARTLVKQGDLIMRDMRVWHGGMPNNTQTHRPMLAMVYRTYKPEKGTFEAEAGSEDFWNSHSVVKANPIFLPKPIDYLHQGHSRPNRPKSG